MAKIETSELIIKVTALFNKAEAIQDGALAKIEAHLRSISDPDHRMEQAILIGQSIPAIKSRSSKDRMTACCGKKTWQALLAHIGKQLSDNRCETCGDRIKRMHVKNSPTECNRCAVRRHAGTEAQNRREWQREREELNQAKAAHIKELKAMPYREYLKTPHWQETRKWMLKARYKCSVCAISGQLHVHHNSYERLGHEEDSDLVVLCKDCHETFHGR